MANGVEERFDESVLWYFGNVERMEKDRIVKGVYVEERGGKSSLGRPRKRWIHKVKDYLRKRGLDVRQARRMVPERSEWHWFVRVNAWDIAQWMNNRCHSCGLSQLYEACGCKSVCGRACNLRI